MTTRSMLALAALTAALCLPDALHAQRRPAAKRKTRKKVSRAPRTLPADQGFDTQRLKNRGQVPGSELLAPAVDRRPQEDALVAHGGLFSNAALPPAGSLTYTNHLFFGHQLSWTPLESLRLSATYIAPMGLILPDEVNNNVVIANYDTYDHFATLAGRIKLHASRDLHVSLEPTLAMRSGANIADTSEIGIGVAGLVDWHAGDIVTLGGGLTAYVPLSFSTRVIDNEQCTNRADYSMGNCTEVVEQTQALPAGGRFLMAHVSATVLGPKNISLKVEAMTGFSTGTALDLSGSLWGRDDSLTQNRRYLDGQLAWGVPRGAPVVLTASGAWRDGRFAAQAGVATIPFRLSQGLDDPSTGPILFPMLSLAYRFL